MTRISKQRENRTKSVQVSYQVNVDLKVHLLAWPLLTFILALLR